MSWDNTIEWCKLLELTPVHVLYRGEFNEELIKQSYVDFCKDKECEGYVVRISNSFNYSDFRTSIAKYVRKNHVQDTVHNWRMCWNSKKINKRRNK